MSNLAISLSTFTFDNSPVRTTEINNQLWFLANDVCSILEYKNPRRAIELHCKEKGVTKRYTLTNGGEQDLIYISEPNLFRLIIKSKQAKAVIFEEWVMEDLLPTIRKTGSYSLTINTEQQQLIKQAINDRHHRTDETRQAIYHKLYNQFKIPRYQDLPSNKFDEAIKFLGGIKEKNCMLMSLDDLKRQYNYLVSIQEYYGRVFEQYNNHLAAFVSKNIPHLHYNISTALGVIQFNTSQSLNLIKEKLGKPKQGRVINFEADIAYLD